MATAKARWDRAIRMTTVSVLAAPPAESTLVDRLSETVLDRAAATSLQEAMFADVCRAIERSGADLVVSMETAGGGDTDEQLPARVRESLANPDAVEVRGREQTDRGEALTREVLRLHEEEVTSAAVVEPSAPFLARTIIDSAAMKLRSSEVVLGPAPDGRVYFAGFAEPVDASGRFQPPAIERLARLADDDRSVDFLPMLPVLERAPDLATAVAHVRARASAGRRVPEATAVTVADRGLTVREEDGELRAIREESG
jgi:glycosyltransferase A (GT-A) superfamily protein (DUF2064 family)